jgi:hypothetical protein
MAVPWGRGSQSTLRFALRFQKRDFLRVPAGRSQVFDRDSGEGAAIVVVFDAAESPGSRSLAWQSWVN